MQDVVDYVVEEVIRKMHTQHPKFGDILTDTCISCMLHTELHTILYTYQNVLSRSRHSAFSRQDAQDWNTDLTTTQPLTCL